MDKTFVRSTFTEGELLRLLKVAPVGIAVCRLDGSFEYVNDALCKTLGYSESEFYKKNNIITHANDFPANKRIRDQLLANPLQPVIIEKRYIHKSGKVILGLLSISALVDKDNKVERFVAQLSDISYRKKMEKSAELFRSMINASHDAMFIVDPKTVNIIDVNLQACQSIGYSYEEMLSLKMDAVEEKIKDDETWNGRLNELRVKKTLLIYSDYKHKNGSEFPVEMSLSHLVQDDYEYILIIVRDITERKKSEELIWHQANYDSLTNLSNRNMFYSRLEHAVKKISRNGNGLNGDKIAVLCLDLDKFKEVNDTLGHALGDELLVETARRLKTCVRETDTVGRIGGDEFYILIDKIDDVKRIRRMAESILSLLSEPFVLDSNQAFVSVSIGVAFFPDDAQDADGLMKKSDRAMYFSKNNGRNCFQFFSSIV